jgi:hypothetical protein
MGVKYLPAYETEASWRSRQSGNIDGFRDTLLALLRAEPVPLDDLTSDRTYAAVD